MSRGDQLDVRPRCQDDPRLFESTGIDDHAKAKALCGACPMLAECRQRLEEARAFAEKPYGLPEGTWAGEYCNPYARTKAARDARIQAEDAAYTDEEARKAHSAHTGGNRSEWARIGHRVYCRRAKQRREAA